MHCLTVKICFVVALILAAGSALTANVSLMSAGHWIDCIAMLSSIHAATAECRDALCNPVTDALLFCAEAAAAADTPLQSAKLAST